MKASNTPNAVCPSCSTRLDKAKMLNGHDEPGPGDTTLCIECATWLVFTDTMTVRFLKDSEWMRFPPAKRTALTMARETLLQVKAKEAAE